MEISSLFSKQQPTSKRIKHRMLIRIKSKAQLFKQKYQDRFDISTFMLKPIQDSNRSSANLVDTFIIMIIYFSFYLSSFFAYCNFFFFFTNLFKFNKH